MNERNKKFLIPALSAIVGGAVVFGVLKLTPAPSVPRTSPVYTQDLFNSDPFGSLAKTFMNQTIAWQGVGGVEDVEQREDKDFVYIDLKLENPQDTSLTTKVEDGYLTIPGTTETKSENKNQQSLFKSSFNRTFPLPDHIDENKMQMSSEKDRIVLKFPKIKV